MKTKSWISIYILPLLLVSCIPIRSLFLGHPDEKDLKRFKGTIIHSGDACFEFIKNAKSIEFYEKSFGFCRKFITPENDYGELETGQTSIAFSSKELANSNLRNGFIASQLSQKPFASEIGLVTENVIEIIELALKSGASLVEEPAEKPWGQTVAYIRDIDGFLIEICTPISN
jgi:uncharacterized glyoxalase superfamily protein PhnB